MAQRAAILLVTLVLPSLAAAQTITMSESADQEIPPIINQKECTNERSDTLAFSWTLTTAQAVDLYVSNTAQCPQPSNNTASNAHTASFATNIVTTVFSGGNTAADLVALAQIPCQGSSSTLFICAFPTGTNTTPVATASIRLDLATPPPPTANQPAADDGALNVTWSQGQGTADAGQSGAPASYNVYYVQSGTVAPDAGIKGSAGARSVSVTGGSTSKARVTGLSNGTEYDVEVTALTQGSNESGPSNRVTGTPQRVNDFWRVYKGDGGKEEGGCAAGAAGMLAILAVPLALRAWRKRS